MFDFTGKVALITGGARGIGFGIARELLRNQVKGIALLDNNSESGIKAVDALAKEFSEERVVYINVDVSDKSQFEDAFEQIIQKFKRLDIVVNNAGMIQEQQWEKCIAVNFLGCITGSLLALDKYFPKTVGTSEGIILNVASVLGLFPCEYTSVYSGTKHGVVGFSRSISGANRRRNLNVKVLTICPGVTMTALLETTKHNMAEEFLEPCAELFKQWPYQTCEELAQHTVSIMRNAKNGSIWTISGNSCREIEIPDFSDVL